MRDVSAPSQLDGQGPGATHVDVWHEPKWLVAELPGLHRVASWAVTGGGIREASRVAWYYVDDKELHPRTCPRELLSRALEARGLDAVVGMLTSRRLDTFRWERVAYGDMEAECIATVGLGNALRAGDSPGPAGRIDAQPVGTINLLCRVSRPMSAEALLEALSIAAEARTVAIREQEVPSGRSGLASTGTGTDCIVIAAPRASETVEPSRWAGKHTGLGHVIGASVECAVGEGARRWCDERRAASARAPAQPTPLSSTRDVS